MSTASNTRAAQTLKLPTYWTPEQALAVFEFLEMLRDELRAAYEVKIQRAFRDDLMPEQGSLPLDPEEPF